MFSFALDEFQTFFALLTVTRTTFENSASPLFRGFVVLYVVVSVFNEKNKKKGFKQII